MTCLGSSASAQTAFTQRLDKAPDGSPTDASSTSASISTDGSTVLFQSGASNLGALPAFAGLPGTSFGGLLAADVATGALEVVHLSSTGLVMPVFGQGVDSVLSADGRFVAFSTKSDDASLGDSNGKSDVYLRDRQFGTTELISVGLSVTGQGPLPSIWGPVDLAPLVIVLGLTADASGQALIALPVSPGLTGFPRFAKGVDVFSWSPTSSFFGVIH